MKKIIFLITTIIILTSCVTKSVVVKIPQSGSAIKVEGDYAGSNEASFKVKLTGWKSVFVSAPDYLPKSFSIRAGSPNVTEVSLERDPNTLARDYILKTDPVDAIITHGTTNVGKGQYSFSLKKNEYASFEVSREGYFSNSAKVSGTDSPGAYKVTLIEDDSWAASAPASDIANKTLRISVTNRNDRTDDDIWFTLMRYASDYFGDFTVNDKNIGWAKSTWVTKSFSKIKVRTRLEIKRNPGNRSEFTVFLASEYTTKKECNDDECYKVWDRVLKTYVELPVTLTSAIQ